MIDALGKRISVGLEYALLGLDVAGSNAIPWAKTESKPISRDREMATPPNSTYLHHN